MKKLTAWLLLTALLLGGLAGCGKDKEEPRETSSPETSSEETITEAFSASSETEEPVIKCLGITTTEVNFRTEPNTDCTVLEVLSSGETLEITGEKNGFYHVKYGEKTGWLSKDYVTLAQGEVPSDGNEAFADSMAAVSEETEDSETTTETAGESSGNGGILSDSGLFPDVLSLPNKSIPYGNDWEDKDENGTPNGIYYYESLYSKYYPVYRIKTGEKKIYLTFDEGYEAGYTPKILDTLKEKNVKAVFFITKQFLDSDPELVQRMIDEGHILGNHTCLHPSGGYPNYVEKNGIDSFTDDVKRLHQLVYDGFGYEMRLFRFPEGESSERLMAKLDNLGYTSVFWTYAHADYNTENQPPVETTLERCMSHLSPGAVYLLHAVSSSNTEALADFIDGARSQGYEFELIPIDEVSKR